MRRNKDWKSEISNQTLRFRGFGIVDHSIYERIHDFEKLQTYMPNLSRRNLFKMRSK
jgi:hypothetical protein